MMMTNAMNFPKISKRKDSEDFSRSVLRLRRLARTSPSSLRRNSDSDTKGMFCRLSVMVGKSVTKLRKVGTKESESRTIIPVRSAMKAMTTRPAASVRGTLLRCRKSTGGCRRSCRRSERKMMKARSGKNQKAESRSVKVIPRMMDVR